MELRKEFPGNWLQLSPKATSSIEEEEIGEKNEKEKSRNRVSSASKRARYDPQHFSMSLICSSFWTRSVWPTNERIINKTQHLCTLFLVEQFMSEVCFGLFMSAPWFKYRLYVVWFTIYEVHVRGLFSFLWAHYDPTTGSVLYFIHLILSVIKSSSHQVPATVEIHIKGIPLISTWIFSLHLLFI